MNVGNVFTKVAKSKTAQKAYSKVLAPKNQRFLNNTLPIIESAVVYSFYIASMAMQKKIDEDSRKAMQIQNVLSMLFSVGLAIPLNKKVGDFGANITKYLKPDLMKEGQAVVNGIQVGLPILNSILISRFLVATALVPISSKIRDKVKKDSEKKKLNIKA